jgi:sulfite oxidase
MFRLRKLQGTFAELSLLRASRPHPWPQRFGCGQPAANTASGANSGKALAVCCGVVALAYACSESTRTAYAPTCASGVGPAYTTDEVALRDGAEGRALWVTHRGDVFDLTTFAKEHPGGAAFLQSAAGGAVEPWWEYWKYHAKSKIDVEALLATYKIGRFADWDGDTSPVDFYANEPVRNFERQHLVMVDKPLNTETWTPCLNGHFFTPAEMLYIRNHAPVPRIDSTATHRVDFVLHTADDTEILVRSMKLHELNENSPKTNVPSVLQCAGNRAADNIKATGPTGFTGTKFETMGVGMAGCGVWGGVGLKNILEGIYGAHVEGRGEDIWVEFHGLDGYFTSIPLEIALDQHRNALLATHMNGHPLNRDHGFPVRVILPGVIGARSVKWLSKVVLRQGEGNSPWNSRYYKAKLPGEAEALKDMPSAMKLPVQSIILTNDASPFEPGGNQFLNRSSTRLLSGVAYSGFSGDTIAKVQVSADQGNSWNDAKIVDLLNIHKKANTTKVEGSFHWVRWELTANCKDSKEVWVRAFASGGEMQPEAPKENPGYLFNGYHKVPVVG